MRLETGGLPQVQSLHRPPSFPHPLKELRSETTPPGSKRDLTAVLEELGNLGEVLDEESEEFIAVDLCVTATYQDIKKRLERLAQNLHSQGMLRFSSTLRKTCANKGVLLKANTQGE